jgi:hypothetical protein
MPILLDYSVFGITGAVVKEEALQRAGPAQRELARLD